MSSIQTSLGQLILVRLLPKMGVEDPGASLSLLAIRGHDLLSPLSLSFLTSWSSALST